MTSLTPILIIGSSRSGTSLLARVLSANGVFMGADVESNHESKSLQAVNRWILLNAGGGLETPTCMDRLLRDVFMRQAVAEVLASYVMGRASGPFWGSAPRPAIWGFKDPRTTFTLPIWLDLFPEARVIHMRRHGCEVAHSLRARRQRVEQAWRVQVTPVHLVEQHRTIANLRMGTLTGAVRHWRAYVTRAERHVAALGPTQAHTVHYEDLARRPEDTLADLSAFLGVALPERIAFQPPPVHRGRVTPMFASASVPRPPA